jgi:transcriptional regulator of arginine metabolism
MDTRQEAAARAARRRPGRRAGSKRERQQLELELIARHVVTSQHHLVDLLAAHGVAATQATVSRDFAELGLVRISSDGQHAYASPETLATVTSPGSDDRLRRVLADYPVRVGRSGLTLLLVSEAGTAGAIGQAIDESTLQEQEGTLAGDNTILVLFADEARLEGWLAKLRAMLPGAPRMRDQR